MNEELKFFCENSKKMGGQGVGGGVGLGGGVRVDVIEELKFLGKFTQKNWGVGGLDRGDRVGVGGSEWMLTKNRSFCEKSKKNILVGRGGGRVGG